MAQFLDIFDRGKLKVDDCNVSTVFGNGTTQIIDTAHQVYSPKMVVQGLSQGLTHFCVALGDNYTKRLHTAHPWWAGGVSAKIAILQDTLQAAKEDLPFCCG
jgi:hypothetical protein